LHLNTECAQKDRRTEGQQASQYIPRSLRSLGRYNKNRNVDHILGTGILPGCVTHSNVPLYPSTKASAGVPSNVSKGVDQQVSKSAKSQDESLTHAQVCENVGDERLKIELDR